MVLYWIELSGPERATDEKEEGTTHSEKKNPHLNYFGLTFRV